MKSFFDSVECRSGTHCKTCRSKIGGRAFRSSIAAYFAVETTDWDCPHGRRWDMDGQPEPLPLLATSPLQLLAGEPLKRRLDICHQCDEFNGSMCERTFPKGCCLCTWQAFLDRGICPLMPSRWSQNSV